MISIIVPVYNAERYISRCVESLVGQSYQDLEVILVDDGSKDNSLQLCNEWVGRDKRVHVVVQANQGVSAARNAGLAHATGKYIMFLDSDDYMKPDMCAVMLSKMEDKNADLVICGTEENGGTYWKPRQDADYASIESLKLDFVQLLMTELLSPPWNKLYKKEKITSGFPVGVSFGEDLIFNLSYLKNCRRVSFIADALHFHEKENADSLVRKTDLHRLTDIERVQSAISDFYGNEPATTALYAKYAKDIACYSKILLSAPSFARKEILATFKKWRANSHISQVNILSMPTDRKSKIVLLCLKYRLWPLLSIIACRKRRRF